jgi:rod shape-determining protein MreC
VAILLAQIIGLAVQVRRPAATGSGDTSQVRLIRYWVTSVVSPLEEFFLFIGHGVRGAWHGYLDLRGVRSQNIALQAEVDRLRMEQASLAEDVRQGQRLQALLGFKQQYAYQTVAAQVIGTSGTDQSRVLLIDKGFKDGLRPDMPVITPDGVVGKVRDVFRHSAQVLEINDQASGLGVILQSTRLRGILRGNAEGRTEIINILPDEQIHPGEAVITSGGDQVFPRGLPVGVVERVVNDPERTPYMAVLVHPDAKLSRLEEVLVITQIGSSLPAQEESDLISSEQRAADVLAQRLPGTDTGPEQPKLSPNGKPLPGQNPNAPPPPAQPPQPLHPDRFSPPSGAPDAAGAQTQSGQSPANTTARTSASATSKSKKPRHAHASAAPAPAAQSAPTVAPAAQSAPAPAAPVTAMPAPATPTHPEAQP